ncbi:hypothetical protein [Kitasatospora sp. A2-31]|nr:hypothetical protein [Kitasatospora sp. A2-31]MCG6499221.1 hypothetical protein [Kitasatospora sp. A2-31]
MTVAEIAGRVLVVAGLLGAFALWLVATVAVAGWLDRIGTTGVLPGR